MSSIYIWWLIFSCDLLSLYPAVHFLSVGLSGIMAIMNSKGDRASPWKIPLRIYASAKLLPPAINSTLPVFMVLSIKFLTSCNIVYIFRLFIIQMRNNYYYYYYYYYFTHLRGFYASVCWWFSTEVWVTASLLNSLGLFFSGWSQQCSILDGLHSSSYFQVLQYLYQWFGAYTKRDNYN